MGLKEFGYKICDDLKKVLGEDCEVVLREVVKNNGVCLHGIVVAGKESNVSLAIYIDELYKDYKEGRAFGDIVYDILCIYKRYARKQNIDMEFFTQFEQAKGRILYKLIHQESNRELLLEIPYKKWNDLALVFYYALEDERFGQATILIRNSHLKMWGIDLDSLYEAAKNNMAKLRPEEMLPVRELIQEFITNSGYGRKEEAAGLPGDFGAAMEQDSIMYVLTNRARLFGAAALLYSDSMKLLAKRIGKNLIILPSSVHEVILVPDDGISDKAFFKNMVKEVNDTQVDPEERLSYNIYYYDRFSERITVL